MDRQNTVHFPQSARVAIGLASHHGSAGHHLHSGDVLPVSVAVSPPAKSHPASQNPEAKNQEQGQGEEQAAGRHAAIFRLCHLEEPHSSNHSGLHLLDPLRNIHALISGGKQCQCFRFVICFGSNTALVDSSRLYESPGRKPG